MKELEVKTERHKRLQNEEVEELKGKIKRNKEEEKELREKLRSLETENKNNEAKIASIGDDCKAADKVVFSFNLGRLNYMLGAQGGGGINEQIHMTDNNS